MKIKQLTLILFTSLFFIFSCGGATTSTDKNAASRLLVKKEEYGEKWPFTVNEGYLACENGTYVIFISKGVKYALNGTAESVKDRNGYLDVRPIWKDDPDVPGLKIGIGTMLDKGNELCH